MLHTHLKRQHEVGELLPKVSVERGLPEWFLSELPAIILVSKRLVENRGPAFYGDEAAFSPPRKRCPMPKTYSRSVETYLIGG